MIDDQNAQYIPLKQQEHNLFREAGDKVRELKTAKADKEIRQ